MHKERFKMGSYVVVILRHGDKIFLIRRANTGFDDGLYSAAGGCVDENETITHAAIREAQEELGIQIKPENLKMAHVLHRRADSGVELLGFFTEVSCWEGEPKNLEPHKHDDIGWFSVDELPHNTIPSLVHVLAMIKQGIFYSELGW